MDDKPPDDEEKPSVKGQEEQQLGEANRGQDHVPHFQGQQQMGRDNVGQVYPHAQYGNRTHQNDPSQAMDYPVNYPAHNSPMPQYSPQNRYPFYRSPPMYPQYPPHPQAGMPQGLYQYPMYAPTVPRMHQPNAGQYPSYPNMPQPHPGQYPFPGGQAERFDQSFQKQHATSPGYPGTATTDVQSPGRVSEPNGPQQPMDCPGDQQSYDMPEHVHQVEEHENEATGHAQEQAMYDTGASESENSMSDESDDSEEAIGLLVEGLMKISEKSVRSYFGNRRKSGGGDISSLSLYEDRHSAVIYFKDAAGNKKHLFIVPNSQIHSGCCIQDAECLQKV
ncbi:trithorax group protein osa-like [Gigantopelta aegis]|uniref:trithorax group protein osa-like n=1 Tax=Gigantopelta aegis TaxID=1735272 RepID=UPI001B88B80C|nr:trithorax group protein osa-like [Gigantopelta aegis]XP_041368049.1 trithorax group protein osa-like [Gigantopelta aegis]